MKRVILLLSLSISLIISSCDTNPEPISDFFISNNELSIGQEIIFHNNSVNADHYEWNFGDGTFSNDEEPIHCYDAPGSYEVTLTVHSRNGRMSQSFMSLEITVPTLLWIDVALYPCEDDSVLQYITNARVRLYPTLADWDQETNALIEGYTDQYGCIVFSHLPNAEYYVDIQSDKYNNEKLGLEDAYNIYIPEIQPNFINWYIFYVDELSKGHSEKTIAGLSGIHKQRKQIIKKTFDYDKNPSAWKEAYDKSIKYKK